MFYKKKIYYVNDIDEFNRMLRNTDFMIRTTEDTFKEQKKATGKPGYEFYILESKVTNVVLDFCDTYVDNNWKYVRKKFARYIFKLDGKEEIDHVEAMNCFAVLQRMSNKGVHDMRDDEEFYDSNIKAWKISANSGILYKNPKYIGKRTENCISYDVNSSYSWAMKQPIPDTKVKYRSGFLEEGEIGFNEETNNYDDKIHLHAHFNKGEYCEYIYPAIESPFVKFVDYYYEKKKNAKTKEERQKYKDYQNFTIGYIRRYNPFVHACIIERSNIRIYNLIDKNTIRVCVDSITSTKERTDLDLGEGVGQFKIEHKGSFALTESGFQWNNDVPSVRGKSKQWFLNEYGHEFDILKDKLPFTEANLYKYDEKTNRIIKIER